MLSREFLLDRGYCCGHGCLMCPYIPKHTKGNTMTTNIKARNKLGRFPIELINHNGLAWKDKQYGVAIIHTPKCASTTIRAHILKDGPCNLNDFKDEEYKVMTVMRNPSDRFFSGITTALHSNSNVCFFSDSKYKEGTWKERLLYALHHVKHEKYYNIHIVPQVWFHNDREGNPFPIQEYLKFEEFNKEIQRTLSQDLIPVQANKTPIHEIGIMELKGDPEVESAIREAYAEDFECYNLNIGK